MTHAYCALYLVTSNKLFYLSVVCMMDRLPKNVVYRRKMGSNVYAACSGVSAVQCSGVSKSSDEPYASKHTSISYLYFWSSELKTKRDEGPMLLS